MPFDGIFMRCALEEIKKRAVGARIEKIYQPEKEEIILVIKKERLLINLSSEAARIGYSQNKRENPPVAPNFCMLLRKALNGARLSDVLQQQNDRTATLVFEAYNEMGDIVERCLQIEIMGRHSNLILTENGRISDSVKRIDFSLSTVRQILPGMQYELPPQQEKEPVYELDCVSLAEEIALSDAPIHKQLLNKISGLSPLWSRELCFKATGSTDTRGSELGNEGKENLINVLNEFAEVVKGCNFTPVLLNLPGGKKDFTFAPVYQYGEGAVEICPSFESLTDNFYASRNAQEYIRQRGTDIQKLINNHIERLSKKLDLLKNEYEANIEKEIYKVYGELINANMYQIKEGDTSFTTINFYSENGEEITIPLDEMLSPSENAQRFYKIYRKAKTAQEHQLSEMEKAQMELSYLLSVADALSRCETAAELSEIREELEKSGFAKNKGQRTAKGKQRRYHTYVSDDGFEIIAGRNNLQNDEITNKVAARQDIWLHAKDAPGAHVVIRANNCDVPDSTIEQAAIIAATLSTATGDAKIPIDFTKICYVKKIPGAHPGLVTYVNQTTILIQPDKALCTRLEKK